MGTRRNRRRARKLMAPPLHTIPPARITRRNRRRAQEHTVPPPRHTQRNLRARKLMVPPLHTIPPARITRRSRRRAPRVQEHTFPLNKIFRPYPYTVRFFTCLFLSFFEGS